MRASVFTAKDSFARLRRRIAEIEGRPAGGVMDQRSPPSPLRGGWGGGYGAGAFRGPALAPRRGGHILPFALPGLDRMLAGGLRRDALHEMRCDTTRAAAAATGFAAAILARLAEIDDRPVLWIAEAGAAHEAGLPYGAGLDRFGCDSSRLIVVRVKKPGDVLWVFEEGLACRGLAAVLAEIHGNPRVLDLTATRRLALRARAGGVMGLLLRPSRHGRCERSPHPLVRRAAAGRVPDDYPAGIGRPAWHLALERNRRGRTGAIDVEWDHERRAFAVAEAPAAAHPLPVAALPSDRPPAPPDAGKVVRLAVASDGRHHSGSQAQNCTRPLRSRPSPSSARSRTPSALSPSTRRRSASA